MKKLIFIFAIFLSQFSLAQSKYVPSDLFGPLINYQASTIYRSASGQPGPAYWQNKADYKIKANLDTAKNEISGSATIDYTNNSPDALGFIWLQLDQNKFDPNSLGSKTTIIGLGRYGIKDFEGGYVLSGIKAQKLTGASVLDTFIVADTRMQVRLKEPLLKGQKLRIQMNFKFKIPGNGADRMGKYKAKQGMIYEIAQWYPRVCVYDDIEGWNVLPYLGAGEFYLEYGDYEYEITAPADQVVMGSGQLLNAAEILSSEQLKRLAKAANSNKTVLIMNAKEALKSTASATRTWKFSMKNTRDVAWASSNAFLWDAAMAKLPSGKKVLVQSVYPEEEKDSTKWGRATEYLKHTIEFYSDLLIEYPYPVATNVAGIVTGMEYPGIVFCGAKSAGDDLFGVTDHEFGHTWFPMIVGSNERKFAWMDEGFNTYINEISVKAFNKGEYYKAQKTEKATFFLGNEKAVMTTPDAEMGNELGILAYFKPGVGLRMLDEVILGHARFRYAFKEYARRWAFKHPSPYDFFHTINNAAGEDLNWFWKGWFEENYKLDQSIKSVSYINDKPENGTKIEIENLDKMAMPVELEIKEENKDARIITLPVQIWEGNKTWQFAYPSSNKIEYIKLNPSGSMPDYNSKNNTWKPETTPK